MPSASGYGALFECAKLARRSIAPGLINGSDGACLHASMLLAVLLSKFGPGRPTVRGGGGEDGLGAVDTSGRWNGHYWLEVLMPSGAVFVVDITADQFGFDPVVIMPLSASSERYRAGDQAAVDYALHELALEFGCDQDARQTPSRPLCCTVEPCKLAVEVFICKIDLCLCIAMEADDERIVFGMVKRPARYMFDEGQARK